jgi:NAD(P)-dependent dehydrogenase (short-subunit alcohol dehydrogenase family)
MRAAIVTGATSGIGRATALALSHDGWWVAVCGRDERAGKEVVDALENGGELIARDLTDEDAPAAVVQRTLESAGRLDLLVNNAGLHGLGAVDELTDAQLDAIMAVNVRAAVRLAREAVRAMRAGGGGVVVNVASEAGLVAVPGQVAYNVSKAALVMLTRSIAVDHAADGIRALSVCPGTTRTPLVDEAIAAAPDSAAHERRLAESRPLGRLGTPEEIASAVVFAAGERASFMTGTEIVVDGGYTAV